MEDFIAMTLPAAAYWTWAAALVCAVAWAILDVEEQKVKDMISDGWGRMSVQRPKLHKGPLAECRVCNAALMGLDECFRLISPGKKRGTNERQTAANRDQEVAR